MRLQTLELRNFKGLPEFTLPANSQSINVFGRNEAGKTSIFDAFSWLLFNKDSLDRKDFGIKPIGFTGIDCEVEATLDDVTLKKVYKEVYTKKRGQARAEFTGHTTDYYVNGVPQKQKEYEAFIKSMIDEGVFRLLTNPRFFNEVLEWKRRREQLMEMCGVSGEDMKKISDDLKVAKAKQTEINQKLKEIPTRIDEATRALPEAAQIDSADWDCLRAELKSLQEKRANMLASGGQAELKQQLAEIDTELLTVKNQQRVKIDDQISVIRRDHLNQISNQISESESLISQKRRESGQLLEEANRLNETQTKLREDYLSKQTRRKEIDSQVYKESDICPTCGADHDSWAPEYKDRLRENFNSKKSEQLEELDTKLKQIDSQGKSNKARLEEIKERGDQLTNEINELSNKLPELKEQETFYKAQIQELEGYKQGIEGIPEYLEVLAKKDPILKQLETSGKATDTTEIDKDIKTTQEQIAEQERIAAAIKQREQGLARIEDLKAEEKRLSEEYGKQEMKVFEVENDLRASIESLEGTINGKFETISVKLFNQLINGGIEDCCVVTSKTGVEYGDMSNSQKIRAGLEIIRVLSKHYGAEVPVFIDNAESCDHLIDMGNTQVIRLIVSPGDKTLRVEPANIRQEVIV